MNHFKWQYPMQPSSFGMEQNRENQSRRVNERVIDNSNRITKRENDVQKRNLTEHCESGTSWRKNDIDSKSMCGHEQDNQPLSMTQERFGTGSKEVFNAQDMQNVSSEQSVSAQAEQPNQPMQSDGASQSLQQPRPLSRPQPPQSRPSQPPQISPQSQPMRPVRPPISPMPNQPMRPIQPMQPPMPPAPMQPMQPVRPPISPMPNQPMRPIQPIRPSQPIQPMRPSQIPGMPQLPRPNQPPFPIQLMQSTNDEERENRRDISQGSVNMEMPEFNPTTLNANTGEQKLPANINSSELGSVTLDGTGSPAETYILQYDIIPFDRFTRENQESGLLKIQAYAARQALPIEGVKIIVGRRFSDGDRIFFEGATDANGLIENISLPAPSKSLSLSSGNMITSAVYDLYAELGELEPVHYTVNVYDSVETIQPIILRTLVR